MIIVMMMTGWWHRLEVGLLVLLGDRDVDAVGLQFVVHQRAEQLKVRCEAQVQVAHVDVVLPAVVVWCGVVMSCSLVWCGGFVPLWCGGFVSFGVVWCGEVECGVVWWFYCGGVVVVVWCGGCSVVV